MRLWFEIVDIRETALRTWRYVIEVSILHCALRYLYRQARIFTFDFVRVNGEELRNPVSHDLL